MRTTCIALLCTALIASAYAQARRPAPVYQKPLQRDGAHHDHGHGHDQSAGDGYSDGGYSGGAGGGFGASNFGGSDYSAGGGGYSAGGGGYTAAPSYSAPAAAPAYSAPAAAAPAYSASAPAAGYSAGAAPSYSDEASSYGAAPAAATGGDYGNTQSQGYYYYYYPVQDSKGSKLKNKAKGAWDSMLGSMSGLAGKIPKLPSHYKEDDDALYGLAVAALVLLIIAAVLLVTVPFVSLAVPSFSGLGLGSLGSGFSVSNIFNTTGTGLTLDLSFLGIPLTLYNPFFGRESAGPLWGSWFTPENVDKISTFVMEKIEDYRKKVE